jgi:hypothetical protein
MKILQWILLIVVAGILTIGTAGFIMHYGGSIDLKRLTPFQYWITYLTIPSVAFALFVFLSAVFVPRKKKYAVLLVIFCSIIFISLEAHQHYSYDGFLAEQFIIRYTGFTTGLMLSFIASYIVYKNRSWA